MKNVTKMLTRFLILTVFSTLFFQNVGVALDKQVTIGNGTLAYNLPFDGYYYHGRAQYLYTAAEMSGLMAGQITQIGFEMTANAGGSLYGLTFKMKNTTATSLPAGAFDNTGFTQVWYGNWAPPIGWYDFVLQTPFVWDGTSNVIIDMCFDNSDWGYSYSRTNHTAMPNSNFCRYYKSDYTTSCGIATGNSLTARVNVRLTQPGGTLSGTVRNSASVPIQGVTITGGGNSTISAANGTYSMSVYAGTNNYTAAGTGWCDNTQSAFVPVNGATTLNFVMLPPPTAQGIVTNAANGAPVKGAKVLINGLETYSTEGGLYTLPLTSLGTYTVTFSKAGFENFVTAPIAFTTPGAFVTVNAALLENLNPASQPFTAALNTGSTAVNLNWGLPMGGYELIYDDGIKDLTTVWEVGGNMNAVKFTALNYPVGIYGGKVHIGDASDYAPGTDPTTLAPFQVQLYDATGAAGMPGNPIGDPIDIQPTHFGWISFDIPYTSFSSGNFFLVMTQGGNAAVAARLGVDNTTNNLRAFSKFVTGGGNWLPADGNFMMRLTAWGVGGPLTDATDGITGYQVYRLIQGQEGDPTLWTSVSTPTTTSTVDNSWPSLPDSAFRWAVKTKYTGNRWSDYIFSNVLGKNRTVSVTVNVDLTCEAAAHNGSLVTLTNTMSGVDTVYSKLTDITGTATFPAVWKGPYELKVTRAGYDAYTANVSIYANHTYDVTVLQMKVPARNMYVDDLRLEATWNAPVGVFNSLEDDFSSGSFVTNGWTTNGAWFVGTGIGNPAPSAELLYYPYLYNYDYSLFSRTIDGSGSPDFKLYYDIILSDWNANNTENLDVEISVGGGPWSTLKHYTNDGGFNWTTETVDLAAYTNSSFQLRFRATGVYSDNITYWAVDNVEITNVLPDPKPCILAYNVYLNGVLDGVTLDTTYNIPPNHVVFRQPYEACVKVVYGSGYSTPSCYDFVSQFLYPPTEVEATAVECVAYITWVKPAMAGKVKVNPFKGTFEHSTPNTGLAPIAKYNKDLNQQNVKTGFKGSIAFGAGYDGNTGITGVFSFDIDDLAGYTFVAEDPLYAGGDFIDGMAAPVGQNDWVYAVGYYSGNLYQVDKATGSATNLGYLSGGPAGYNEITIDKTTGEFYGFSASSSNLYKIDPVALTSTLVGNFGTANVMIAIACDGAGNMWGYDIGNDMFYSIDKATGAATAVGSIGFDAGYAQSMTYDQATDNIIMCAFNAGSFYGEIRAVDVNTGSSVILSDLYFTEVCGSFIPLAGGGGDPPGLYGYKVYRDGDWLADVVGKDNTEYYDYTVNPGVHTYEVSAWYDLTDYGYAGEWAESYLEGPDTVDIICGRDLPFFEPWDQASFDYNDWTAEGNWSITTAIGNPVPSADFSWIPPATLYEQSIVTPTLSAGKYTCATIWCDFDLQLVDRNATGAEFLYLDIYKDGAWKEAIAEFSNTGSYDWTAQHIELKNTIGKAFMVRFRAKGENSQDLLHWYVDNIHVYAVCTPPTALTVADIADNDVYLKWTPPTCETGCTPLSYIFYGADYENGWGINPGALAYLGNYYPIDPGDAGVLQSFDVYFDSWGMGGTPQTLSIEVYDDARNLVGESDQFSSEELVWINVTAPDIPFAGPFYAMVKWDNVPSSSPFFCLDEDADPLSWYMDETNGWLQFADMGYADGDFWMAANACIGGKNVKIGSKNNPKPVAKKQVNASDVKAFQAGLKDQSRVETAPIKHNSPAASSLQGYNVFRSDDGQVTWTQLNTSIITDTTYADMDVAYGEHFYYVNSVFAECISDSSNNVKVDLVTGIDQLNNGAITVYPNPATEVVNVKSNFVISQIEVMNYVGQIVYNKTNVDTKNAKIDVATFQSGVYFVKVTTSDGVRTVKITVTK